MVEATDVRNRLCREGRYMRIEEIKEGAEFTYIARHTGRQCETVNSFGVNEYRTFFELQSARPMQYFSDFRDPDLVGYTFLANSKVLKVKELCSNYENPTSRFKDCKLYEITLELSK